VARNVPARSHATLANGEYVSVGERPTTISGVGGLLERTAQLEALDDHLGAVRAQGRGRLVLIGGEAGIGKTALVRAFCDGRRPIRVLWGACDALYTPRPLGPFVDMADEVGGELGEVVAQGTAPGVFVAALARELGRRPPTVVVVEDLHWADEATLDVLRLLARRLEALPALVLATYRDDELDRAHPLRIVLGELPRPLADRVMLAPLSAAAVGALAGSMGVDHGELHRRTAGNPFFVTEVLAAADADIPETVRDAVLARAARLDEGARALLDAVAIVPLRAELWLLEALADGDLTHLDACLGSGMLRADRDAVSFRHEVARAAVEEALSPHSRVLLHRKALAALATGHGGRPDLARLAHHAEAADDGDAVLRHAPAAGERAAALGSHREAASQFARALRHAANLPPERRAELLERRSYECYLTDDIAGAIEARRRALHEHRAAGDSLREGDAHRWLSRLAWFSGDNATAEDEARLAVELLEPLAPGRELAMAYSNMAQLRMLASDTASAATWGARAIELAERLDETEIVVHALNNVGSAELLGGLAGGRAKLERSLQLALEAGLEEHVARAYTNLGAGPVEHHDYALGDRHLDAGIAYCAERDLDAWRLYMTGWRARSELDQGRWDAAAASATVVLAHPGVAAPSRITPLGVVGRLRARRGDPDPWSPLDEALELARATGELQRLAAAAGARAEARWLAGENEEIAAETDAALALALEQREGWAMGELYLWRRRAGIVDEIELGAVAEPFRLELEGAWEAAAERWTAIGCPYEAALALGHADADSTQRRGLAELQALGAHGAARRVARALRARGIRDVRRGPHAATRDNPAGLTARELEVLDLVAEGLRNAEIAGRLFVSEKTVAHHVSAILRKLDVRTRSQAGAEAARLGIVER
jgi:DNA-binding CsgD family transcriptional regulator/tetratricopeptide (TPR) repeat protein